MGNMFNRRSPEAASLVPFVRYGVEARLESFTQAVGGWVDPSATNHHATLPGSVTMPLSSLFVAGTSCGRPLLLDEAEAVGEAERLDVVLLRFDTLCGVSFDIKQHQGTRWHCNYVAWRQEGDLWLVPQVAEGPFFRLSGWGLVAEERPPFASSDERARFIIRAERASTFAAEM